MDKRTFLKKLGILAGAGIVSPAIVAEAIKSDPRKTVYMIDAAMIPDNMTVAEFAGQVSNYSDMMVMKARRKGMTMMYNKVQIEEIIKAVEV
jgi:hypothetical protein